MNKQLLLIATTLLFTSLVYSQSTENNSATNSQLNKFLLGGNVSLVSNSSNENLSTILTGDAFQSTFSSFTLSPYLGYQLNSNWIIGLELFYGTSNSELANGNTIQSESNSSRLDYGLFARYFFYTDSRLSAFLQPAVGLFNTNSDFTNFNVVERSSDGISLRLGLGLNYNLSSRWRLISTISFLSYERRTETVLSDPSNPLPPVSIPNPDPPVLRQTKEDFTNFNARLSLSNINFGVEFLF